MEDIIYYVPIYAYNNLKKLMEEHQPNNKENFILYHLADEVIKKIEESKNDITGNNSFGFFTHIALFHGESTSYEYKIMFMLYENGTLSGKNIRTWLSPEEALKLNFT
jgi:hypothetical protein